MNVMQSLPNVFFGGKLVLFTLIADRDELSAIKSYLLYSVTPAVTRVTGHSSKPNNPKVQERMSFDKVSA